MGLGERLKRLFKSEAHAAVNKLEDPTKISEQVIRELGEKLQEAINAEAQVKAIALKNKSEALKAKSSVEEWSRKVEGMLDKIEKEGSSPELEKLAEIAAGHYDDATKRAAELEKIASISNQQANAMEGTIKTLQTKISEAKDKSKNIEARQQIAEASKTINMAMSSTNTDGLMATLEHMEEKVAKDEFVAEAYANSTGNSSDEAKINEALNSNSASSTLAAFKAKRQQK